MGEDVSPGMPRRPAFQDPELIDSVARSFASALTIEAISAAIDRNLSQFFLPGSWSLSLSDLSGSPDPPEHAVRDSALDGSRNLHEGLQAVGCAAGKNLLLNGREGPTRTPLVWDGAALGWIDWSSGERAASQQPPAGFARLVADYAAIALHNANEVSRVQALAIVDDLTGLYNSRHLSSVLVTEIERSRRFHLPFSLLFIDLDYFKKVNDAHGHMAGSWLLARIAETIRSSIRGIDSAFRYGGDEFVVLLPQTGKESALEVGVRLLNAFRVNHHIFTPGVSLTARASIGLAAYPEDGQTAEDLILAADAAMYQVKNTTRDDISAAGSGSVLEFEE